MENYIFSNPIIAIMLYIVILTASNYFVFLSNRYYASKLLKIRYETLDEQLPSLKKESHKALWSPQFVRVFIYSVLLLAFIFFYIDNFFITMFLYGFFLIPIIVLSLQHLQSIMTSRFLEKVKNAGVSKQTTISAWLSYRSDANRNLLSGAVLFLLLFILTGSPVLLGGTFAELNLSRHQFRLSNQAIAPRNGKNEIREKRLTEDPPLRPKALNFIIIGLFLYTFYPLVRMGIATLSIVVYILKPSLVSGILLQVVIWITTALLIAGSIIIMRGLWIGKAWSPLITILTAPLYLTIFWADVFFFMKDNSISMMFGVTTVILSILLTYLFFRQDDSKLFFIH
jgi:hypothetical protein